MQWAKTLFILWNIKSIHASVNTLLIDYVKDGLGDLELNLIFTAKASKNCLLGNWNNFCKFSSCQKLCHQNS